MGSILNPDQIKKRDEMRQNRINEMKNRHSNKDSQK
jgi:hypothetical protein